MTLREFQKPTVTQTTHSTLTVSQVGTWSMSTSLVYATTAGSTYLYGNCMVCRVLMGDVVVNHTPPDNDIQDSRCVVNHYHASLSTFLIKF